jgi:hypothetical protein
MFFVVLSGARMLPLICVNSFFKEFRQREAVSGGDQLCFAVVPPAPHSARFGTDVLRNDAETKPATYCAILVAAYYLHLDHSVRLRQAHTNVTTRTARRLSDLKATLEKCFRNISLMPE